MFSILGFDFNISICTKGSITMLVPVIKAEFDAEVYFNPDVCVRNPMNIKIPKYNPYLISSNLNFTSFFMNIREKISVVNANLNNTKVKGEE